MVPVTLVTPLDSPSPATSPARTPDTSERARLTDGIVSGLKDTLAGTTDRESLTQELIEANLGVARSIASRYRNRGIDLDDLEQVAMLGLTKAAQRFDADAGHDFLSYAVPTVRGEIRRHFRDAGWMIRPPRRIQDLQARLGSAQHELEHSLGRSPRPSEIAVHLGEDLSDVVEALAADGCFTPTSLDLTIAEGSSTLGDQLGGDDRHVASAEARIVLEPVIRLLSTRDRLIVQLRFLEDRTQQEIAEAVGLTQAQVSRVLTRILANLRAELVGTLPAA